MIDTPFSFPCPYCNEYINTSMERCRFCSQPIDRQLAQQAAYVQERVNQAYNQANYIRLMAGTMWIFFLLRLIPFVGGIMTWGLLITFFGVPISVIVWHGKFSGIQTRDPDFAKAKRTKNMALLIWAPVILCFPLLVVLSSFM